MRIKHLLLKIYSNLSRPSFSFRNRLFVERSDKHARISGLLSNTFRSSKWSSLSMLNISSRFNNLSIVTWTRPTYLFLGSVLTYCLIDSIFGLSALQMFVSYTWAQIDSVFQIVLQWIMIKWALLGKAAHSVFVKAFNLYLGSSPDDTASNKTSQLSSDTNSVMPIGSDKQLLLLHHLTSNTLAGSKDHDIVKLFNSTIKRWVYDSYAYTLQYVYRVARVMNLQDLALSGTLIKLHLKRMIASNRFSLSLFRKSEGLEPTSEIRLRLESELSQFVPRGRELESNGPSLRLYNFILNDQLLSYFEEGSLGYRAALTPTEPFTLTDSTELQRLSQRNDTTDFNPLEYSARRSNTFVEHQRRLYRFSLLHRSLLQNSHKLTNAKRLITSGFYDSSLTSNNLWASEFFSRSFDRDDAITHTVKHLLQQTSSLSEPYTPQTRFLSTHSNVTTPTLSLNTLNLFEKSYFWNIKRFYNFNTSHAMTQVLGLDRVINRSSETTVKPSQRAILDILQTYGLKSYTLTNPGFTHQYSVGSEGFSTSTDAASKTIYTQFDNTPLLNSTNTTILHDLLIAKDSSTIRTRSFPFFTDYTSYLTTSIEELTSLKDLNDVLDDRKVNDPTYGSVMFTNERIVLKDLLLLTRIK